MDKEYVTMFKQLMHERNELRKYIINICELLDINTGPSVLGANCLEFYAVLCSTAKNKIGDLQQQLKRKEQECEELRKQLDRYLSQEEEDIRQLNNDNKLDDILSAIKKANDKMEKESKYKYALDEIEINISEYRGLTFGKPQTMRENDCIYNILDIINKVKEE